MSNLGDILVPRLTYGVLHISHVYTYAYHVLQQTSYFNQNYDRFHFQNVSFSPYIGTLIIKNILNRHSGRLHNTSCVHLVTGTMDTLTVL